MSLMNLPVASFRVSKQIPKYPVNLRLPPLSRKGNFQGLVFLNSPFLKGVDAIADGVFSFTFFRFYPEAKLQGIAS